MGVIPQNHRDDSSANQKGLDEEYYPEEQLADLRERWSPPLQAESARGDDPSGTTGRQLAVRRQQLLALFTGGNPGMEESLQKLYADKANWPASFKKPFSDAVDAFLCQAAQASPKPSAPKKN